LSQGFVIRSTAFAANGTLPVDYTCTGAGQSPPLEWSGAPDATRAYTVIEADVDRVTDGTPYTQWLVYNIPSSITRFAGGQPPVPLLSNQAQQGQNSAGVVGYLGPCLADGDSPHHVEIDVFAQDDYMILATGASVDSVREELRSHVLDNAQLLVSVTHE
jgi:Raf kinase inhibitor-like YbhB/YbcL family protein